MKTKLYIIIWMVLLLIGCATDKPHYSNLAEYVHVTCYSCGTVIFDEVIVKDISGLWHKEKDDKRIYLPDNACIFTYLEDYNK